MPGADLENTGRRGGGFVVVRCLFTFTYSVTSHTHANIHVPTILINFINVLKFIIETSSLKFIVEAVESKSLLGCA